MIARLLAEPSRPAEDHTPPVVAHARAVTAQHATTFSIACRLLPARLADDVQLLYLVLRTLDDLVDTGDPAAAERIDAVAEWAQRGRAASTPEVEVLGELARRYSLPRDALAAFCAGMRDDLAGRRFTREAELDEYCYRVAGTVGVLMSSLLGVANAVEARPAAAALGMAMQRTNILRDIDEDAVAGRRYITDEALAQAGGSLQPGRRAELIRGQIARADELYERGIAGIPLLCAGRPAIMLAATLYREILREIERRDDGEQPGRAIVSPGRKLLVSLRALI